MSSKLIFRDIIFSYFFLAVNCAAEIRVDIDPFMHASLKNHTAHSGITDSPLGMKRNWGTRGWQDGFVDNPFKELASKN
jgi:hypothetical protein